MESTGTISEIKQLQKSLLLSPKKILEILIILKRLINGMKSIEPVEVQIEENKRIFTGSDILIKEETKNKCLRA
jgi:hypothetical protein